MRDKEKRTWYLCPLAYLYVKGQEWNHYHGSQTVKRRVDAPDKTAFLAHCFLDPYLAASDTGTECLTKIFFPTEQSLRQGFEFRWFVWEFVSGPLVRKGWKSSRKKLDTQQGGCHHSGHPGHNPPGSFKML